MLQVNPKSTCYKCCKVRDILANREKISTGVNRAVFAVMNFSNVIAWPTSKSQKCCSLKQVIKKKEMSEHP